MFNSGIIDTAIGIVFVYLLLSLICSAIGEAIESVMRNRATDLERGIRELVSHQETIGGVKGFLLKLSPKKKESVAAAEAAAVSPPAEAPQEDIVAKLYDHPLLNGLFRGTYEDAVNYRSQGILKRLVQWIWSSSPKLPTYIPARNFALALLDVAAPGNASEPSGAAGALADPKTFVTSSPPGNPIDQLRNAIIEKGQIPADSKLGKALLTLIDSAGNDVNKARENIENWFDSGMDRASGWYKRRAQFMIFAIGLIVAITVNADTVYIVKKLSTDKALRESVAAAAVEYAKTNAQASPTATPISTPPRTATTTATATPPTTPSPSPSPSPSPTPTASPTSEGQDGSPSPTATATPTREGAVSSPIATPSPSPSSSATPTPTCWAKECKDENDPSLACKLKKGRCDADACWRDTEECKSAPDSPACKVKKNQCELDSLGLPIGWAGGGDIVLTWPGWHWKAYGGWWWQIYWHGVGWLLTALAISLGAPFWFDLLNKFIVIRSTVKPKEKSPEEESKD